MTMTSNEQPRRALPRTHRPLTPNQLAVLRFVARRQLDGVGCTVKDIRLEFGIVNNAVAQHLERLQRKGYITRTAKAARSIRLVGASLARVYDGGEAGERLREALEGE